MILHKVNINIILETRESEISLIRIKKLIKRQIRNLHKILQLEFYIQTFRITFNMYPIV